MRQVRKRLLRDHEFASMALGSNECTNINGSADPNTTGGHVDTAGRRMLSFIGLEDCCGAMWQWLEDVSALGTGTAWTNISGTSANVGNTEWITCDGQNRMGQHYNASTALLAGGSWNGAAYCGSRSRNANVARSIASTSLGGRGASRVLRKA
jgi:formylglycine-generating enzyme required for sulfatase activity